MSINFTIVKNNRDKDSVLHEGFMYYKFRTQKKSVVWRCAEDHKCCASVWTDNSVSRIIKKSEAVHEHECLSKKKIQKNQIRSTVKRKATEDVHIEPAKILRQVLHDNDNELTFSDLPALRLAAYRSRKKIAPKAPASIEEALDQMKSISMSTDETGEKIFVDTDNKIVAVTCIENIEFLTKHSKNILADGTFTYAPRFFAQTYTIHVFANGFYIHVCTFFLPSKFTATYVAMWLLLKKISLEITGCELFISLLLLDFERGAHTAAKIVFPCVQLKACKFHLGQCWWRRIYGVAKLRLAYYSTTTTANQDLQQIKFWLTLFFSLSYLKPDDVVSAFNTLESIAPPHNECKKFANYVRKNYIDSSIYPPTLWACPLTESLLTTTNAVESYNSKLQMEFYASHPNIHVVVNRIFENQSLVALKIKSVMNNETFQRRPKQIQLEENIKVITHAHYTYRYINTLQFLNEIGEEKKLFNFQKTKLRKENACENTPDDDLNDDV